MTRERDAISTARRQLPIVRIDKLSDGASIVHTSSSFGRGTEWRPARWGCSNSARKDAGEEPKARSERALPPDPSST